MKYYYHSQNCHFKGHWTTVYDGRKIIIWSYQTLSSKCVGDQQCLIILVSNWVLDNIMLIKSQNLHNVT